MKNAFIDLHTNTKKNIMISVSFALLSFVLALAIGISVDGYLGHLFTLERSKYVYSADIHNPTGYDEYYQFQAGISFSNSSEMKTGINADIVMQVAEEKYTNKVAWNSICLESNEIAVTSGIAKKLGLNIGSELFSKHIVDASLHVYSVKAILPEAVIIHKNIKSDGIIIMGFDDLYVSNIAHYTTLFTDRDISILQNEYHEYPQNIIYREDEISFLINRTASYLVALVIGLIIISSLYIWNAFKVVQLYFRHLVVLGFPKKKLGHSLNRYVFSNGVFSIITTAILLIFLSLFLANWSSTVIISLLVMIVELATFCIASTFMKRHIWEA